jgi:hypothetical protein
MSGSQKRKRGSARANKDVYEHFNFRDDVEKSATMYSYRYVECRHCREAYDQTDGGLEKHPITSRHVEEPSLMKNILSQMSNHIFKCPYAQTFIRGEDESEARAQGQSRLSSSRSTVVSTAATQPYFQPLLNAPLSAEHASEFKRKILNLTIAAAFPFSWVELPEARAVFEFIRKVVTYQIHYFILW